LIVQAQKQPQAQQQQAQAVAKQLIDNSVSLTNQVTAEHQMTLFSGKPKSEFSILLVS